MPEALYPEYEEPLPDEAAPVEEAQIVEEAPLEEEEPVIDEPFSDEPPADIAPETKARVSVRAPDPRVETATSEPKIREYKAKVAATDSVAVVRGQIPRQWTLRAVLERAWKLGIKP
jgi:hypothetical protein